MRWVGRVESRRDNGRVEVRWMQVVEVSSRKASGSLHAGEKGREEDGVEGVVGKAAEL